MLGTAYTLSETTDASFADALGRVRDELQKEGFGVLCEIDVQATLHEKLGVDRSPYVILGACNPSLAHRALDAEPELGALLPCNVAVYRDDGETRIAAIDPEPPTDTREVTVPVDPLHAPVALQSGDLVDVWSMPRPDAAAAGSGEPSLVLPAAVVTSVADDSIGIGGEMAVVLEVPSAVVAAVVAATRSGVVDLVAVPATAAEVNP